ncbi:MAG TPA: DNA gyrase inhibitor YacG [Gammaproteobacteria bacterium]|nr:DNA gyrase inhibitor YacG [Gammaproteobacteria bacterium]
MKHDAPTGSPRSARCPRCQRPTSLAPDNPWRPFCGERCRLLDCGDWLSGTNALPAEEVPPAAEGELLDGGVVH